MFALVGFGDKGVYVNTRHVKFAVPQDMHTRVVMTDGSELIVEEKFGDVCLQLELGYAEDDGKV